MGSFSWMYLPALVGIVTSTMLGISIRSTAEKPDTQVGVGRQQLAQKRKQELEIRLKKLGL